MTENSLKPKVLFLLGPTGVGKTDMSIKLAKKFNAEIISADSVQVFKGFDIGSAKATQEEMSGVKHYGIDIVCPSDEFSASQFSSYTKEKINEILSIGKLPIIVGGTALYVKSLVEGYNFGGTEKHQEFRENLENEIDQKGLDAVYSRLCQIAPKFASRIDGKNKVRVIRAFEIYEFGSGKEKSKEDVEYDFKVFALTMPREILYQRINKRASIMVANGLVEEVKNLYEKYGYCQPMSAIGYKEVLPYIKGEISLEEMEATISQHTRNYAKRQLTFLRGMDYVDFVDMSEESEKQRIEKEIELWLNKQPK